MRVIILLLLALLPLKAQSEYVEVSVIKLQKPWAQFGPEDLFTGGPATTHIPIYIDSNSGEPDVNSLAYQILTDRNGYPEEVRFDVLKHLIATQPAIKSSGHYLYKAYIEKEWNPKRHFTLNESLRIYDKLLQQEVFGPSSLPKELAENLREEIRWAMAQEIAFNFNSVDDLIGELTSLGSEQIRNMSAEEIVHLFEESSMGRGRFESALQGLSEAMVFEIKKSLETHLGSQQMSYPDFYNQSPEKSKVQLIKFMWWFTAAMWTTNLLGYVVGDSAQMLGMVAMSFVNMALTIVDIVAFNPSAIKKLKSETYERFKRLAARKSIYRKFKRTCDLILNP